LAPDGADKTLTGTNAIDQAQICLPAAELRPDRGL